VDGGAISPRLAPGALSLIWLACPLVCRRDLIASLRRGPLPESLRSYVTEAGWELLAASDTDAQALPQQGQGLEPTKAYVTLKPR
jgi:hypothetical protein